MTHYDLVVIGTGSGNTIVTDDFEGRRVAIIERGVFGGTCINVGCIPTKMFVHPADISRSAAHGPDLGARTSSDGVDWPAVRDRVFGRIDPISVGGLDYREGLDYVDMIVGDARFTGPRTLTVALDAGGEVEISGDQVVIAAGSRALVPDLPGLDSVEHHTSDTVMRLATLPDRIAIVGGGYIGAEFAHVFSGFGSQVTQIHRGDALLQAEDTDVATRFTAIAQQQWDVRLLTTVASVEKTADGIRLHLSEGDDVVVDTLLLATGRVPNGDQLDLDRAGVDLDDQGFVVVDEHQRTTAEGVWALGDVSSHEMLKHVANQDARVVQHNVLHPDEPMTTDHRHIPHAVFSSPQVAAVGLTEREARSQGLDVAVATKAYGDVAYGWAMEDTSHFVKLVGERGTGRLLGAHLIGPEASILVQPLIQAMSQDVGVEGLARGQYWIHPALTEVVENALLDLAAAVLE
ncbi:mycothione reductase [Nocardioides mangrovicus]|uniref:Mycothione reductase n=1 Tax=Nocardioides mangrovicus TaxID=2478913 RepID=A0A3L8NYU6_9ACTN|nr:mycothione reductase [Nocardioides mangrovicus]RLV47743.1 mycothione reductase [Nocardioides mangrovicus]